MLVSNGVVFGKVVKMVKFLIGNLDDSPVDENSIVFWAILATLWTVTNIILICLLTKIYNRYG